MEIEEEVPCYCYNLMVNESYQHLFVLCPYANRLWELFASATGVKGPFIHLKDTIYKWWNVDCVPKLRPLFNVIPNLICWEIWKRRNKLKHGEKMSFYSMLSE